MSKQKSILIVAAERGLGLGLAAQFFEVSPMWSSATWAPASSFISIIRIGLVRGE